jgi:hypothetical protein
MKLTLPIFQAIGMDPTNMNVMTVQEIIAVSISILRNFPILSKMTSAAHCQDCHRQIGLPEPYHDFS